MPRAGAASRAGQIPGQRRYGDDDRKRNARYDQPERDGRERQRRRCVDHASADPDHRGSDERDHCGPKPADDARDCGNLAVLDIDRAHDAKEHERGEHEEAAGGDRAAHAVHRVADVRGKLLRLRARERHAEVERVQEAALRDPATPLDELVVHDRDLPGRPTEADHPNLSQKRNAWASLGFAVAG